MIKNFLYLVITFIPTWLFLLVWHYASPNTFWQRFVILIVGAFFAVLQILCLCIAAYTSFSRFCNEELGKSPDKSSEVQTIRIGLFRPINKEEAVVAVKEGVYDLVVIIMTRGLASTHFFRHFCSDHRPWKGRADGIVWGSFLEPNGFSGYCNNIFAGRWLLLVDPHCPVDRYDRVPA